MNFTIILTNLMNLPNSQKSCVDQVRETVERDPVANQKSQPNLDSVHEQPDIYCNVVVFVFVLLLVLFLFFLVCKGEGVGAD